MTLAWSPPSQLWRALLLSLMRLWLLSWRICVFSFRFTTSTWQALLSVQEGQPSAPNLWHCLSLICRDPDSDYFQLLRDGVPLGISSPIFPRAPLCIRLLLPTLQSFPCSAVTRPGSPLWIIPRWSMSCLHRSWRRGRSSWCRAMMPNSGVFTPLRRWGSWA